MSEPIPGSPLLAEVGRYRSLAEARDYALALTAQGLPYWIDREGDGWVLRVEVGQHAVAARELESFAREQHEWSPAPLPTAATRIPTTSLFIAGWVLSGFFFAQQLLGDSWTARGAAASGAMTFGGEWWRTITALTLHADLPHLAANLAAGLLFATFLIPQLGTGMTWLLIVLSGAFGNALNAFGYRGEDHLSIGASTAVFGALGLLVGCDLAARWSSPATRNRWQLVLPLGAGLALLAYLGAGGGDEHRHVDILAHGWGFAVGLLLGVGAGTVKLKERISASVQGVASGLTIVLIAVSWIVARLA